MNNKKIYYVSQYDNCIHNINDVEHQIVENNPVYQAYIGRDCKDEGFRVDEEVTLYTVEEIMEFYK